MVAKRARNICNREMKKLYKYIFSVALFFASALTVNAQDAFMEEVMLPEPLGKVDTVAQHTTLLNEAYILPISEMYPSWKNSGVHYSATLPDSFRIDLSGAVMPTTNRRITDIFGYRPRRGRVHQGLDIKVQVGDTIYAAFDGKVRITTFQRRGYGHYVVIRHNNGIETLYAHLSKRLVTEDQNVKAGDPIGLGGNTGRSTGSHLHFETIIMGMSIDPAMMFDFENQKIKGDSYLFCKADPKHNEKVKAKYTQPKYHKVRSGDTIGKIAKKHGVSQKTIMRLNGLKSSSIIRPGQRLRIR